MSGAARVTEIVSHRGGALLWPENSRIAFENTIRLAVEQVEFDVHPSRDGKLVVIHDPTLDRTTDGSGAVVTQDWDSLSRLILRGTGGERMLLLAEVIAIFKPTPIKLRLEIKAAADRTPYPELPRKIMETLAAERILDRTTITSFQVETVAAAARYGQPMQRVWLVTPAVQADIGLRGIIKVAAAYDIPMLGLRQSVLDRATLAELRGAGLRVGAWACNDAEAIARMLDLGVDVFTTDRPDLAIELRRGRA
jgi:glycerophosphoryl diester phosphodiesterase